MGLKGFWENLSIPYTAFLTGGAISGFPNNSVSANNCIYNHNYTIDYEALELRINYTYYQPSNTMLALGIREMETVEIEIEGAGN